MPSRRFFFCHLQKTGGSSLITRLRCHFGEDRVYPTAADGMIWAAVISVHHLVSRWPARRSDIDVVTGHFPLCTRELLGEDFTTFTILREPVARTLSYLRHHRQWAQKDRDRSLESIYDDPRNFHGLIHNHMVKMLSLTAAEMQGGVLTRVEFTRERLECAKEQLLRLDLVGIQERFGDFCRDLEARFGLQLGPRVAVNRTRPLPVPEEFRKRIARDNALDIELYEFARQLTTRRG